MTILIEEVPTSVVQRLEPALSFVAAHPRFGCSYDEFEHFPPVPKFTLVSHEIDDRLEESHSPEWVYLVKNSHEYGLLSLHQDSTSRFKSFTRGNLALSFYEAFLEADAHGADAEDTYAVEIVDAPEVQTSAILLKGIEEQWLFPYRMFGSIRSAPRLGRAEFENALADFKYRAEQVQSRSSSTEFGM